MTVGDPAAGLVSVARVTSRISGAIEASVLSQRSTLLGWHPHLSGLLLDILHGSLQLFPIHVRVRRASFNLLVKFGRKAWKDLPGQSLGDRSPKRRAQQRHCYPEYR